MIPIPSTADRGNVDADFLASLQEDSPPAASERFAELTSLLYSNALLSFKQLVRCPDGDATFVDQQDGGGQTFLHLAAFWGRPEIVTLLIELGANCDLENCELRKPIDVAIDWNHRECAEILRKAGGHSAMEDTIESLETKNVALLRSLDVARRRQTLIEKELEMKEAECLSVRNERDDALFQSHNHHNRAEIAEKAISGMMEKLRVMTKEKEKWENQSKNQADEIGQLRFKVVELAESVKTGLVEIYKEKCRCAKFERKMIRCLERLEKKTSRADLLQGKYDACKLKLVLLSKELRARDVEVVRLSNIEKNSKKLQRALQNIKAQTLMESLHALVPVEILTGAFRTLQTLARAGQKAHPYFGGENVPKPNSSRMRKKKLVVARIDPVTGMLRNRKKKRKAGHQRPATAMARASTAVANSAGGVVGGTTGLGATTGRGAAAGAETLPTRSVMSKEIDDVNTELNWEGRVEDNTKCKLMGGVELPFPMLSVSSGGVSCIVVTAAKFDPVTEVETLTIVSGVSNDDLMADEILAPTPTEEQLQDVAWLDGNGRFTSFANMDIAPLQEKQRENVAKMTTANNKKMKKTKKNKKSQQRLLFFPDVVKS